MHHRGAEGAKNCWGDVRLLVPPDPRLMPNRVRNAWVLVDRCVAEAVEALWRFGYVTVSSCCGHGRGGGEVVVIGQITGGVACATSIESGGAEAPQLRVVGGAR